MLYTIKQALEATNTDIYREMMIYHDWTEQEASERRVKKETAWAAAALTKRKKKKKKQKLHSRTLLRVFDALCVRARDDADWLKNRINANIHA